MDSSTTFSSSSALIAKLRTYFADLTISEDGISAALNEVLKNSKIEIGALVKRFRSSKNISQIQLASALGIKQAHISFWENGDRAIPLAHFLNIASIIGVDPAELIPKNSNIGTTVNSVPILDFKFFYALNFDELPYALKQYSSHAQHSAVSTSEHYDFAYKVSSYDFLERFLPPQKQAISNGAGALPLKTSSIIPFTNGSFLYCSVSELKSSISIEERCKLCSGKVVIASFLHGLASTYLCMWSAKKIRFQRLNDESKYLDFVFDKKNNTFSAEILGHPTSISHLEIFGIVKKITTDMSDIGY